MIKSTTCLKKFRPWLTIKKRHLGLKNAPPHLNFENFVDRKIDMIKNIIATCIIKSPTLIKITKTPSL